MEWDNHLGIGGCPILLWNVLSASISDKNPLSKPKLEKKIINFYFLSCLLAIKLLFYFFNYLTSKKLFL